ncbi:MAG: DUF4270 domain-containing protein [Tannerellaceae bacterium]|jgi:hypothetical protein|nr:DUF4270 domain-containing protein [Tannerellaceae bacterium]
MKIKLFILGIVAGSIFLNSCNDDFGLVGPSIQPDEDTPTLKSDTFMLKASTVLLDSVYAKTATGLLGEIYDPLFGDLKADFICQFYVQDGFTFRHEPVDGKIDSVQFMLFYPNRDWIGDSLASMQATLYPVIKPLERNYYTNIDPAQYVDFNNPLASKTYSPRDQTVSDSLWNDVTVTTSGSYHTYDAHIKIKLPVSFGQKFYDESINNPGYFANQEAFNNFFPGLYLTNTFGSGNILSVSDTRIVIYYNYYAKRASTGAVDSAVIAYEVFPVTKEVIQMNRMKNAGLDKLLVPNDRYTYIKSPAGVATRLTIPVKEIKEKIEGRRINTFYFELKTMPQDDWKYALSPPGNVLLIPEDSVKTFFEKGKTEDNITTYLGTYNSASLLYFFTPITSTSTVATSVTAKTNLANLIKYQLLYAPDEDLNMLVIPVSRTAVSTGTNTIATESISNYLKPASLTLRTDSSTMQVQVITSIYDE